MRYIIKREDTYWECGDGCCSEYNTLYHVYNEYGEKLYTAENEKEDAYAYILTEMGCDISEEWVD